jgi:phosphomannomutase
LTIATSQFNFAFDVDGTLTPSRQRIAPSFEEWFLSFCQTSNVYLVSGSDYEKTLEQLGEEICNTVKGVYSCCGNALYVNGELQYVNDFTLTTEQHEYLESLLQLSSFPKRTGNHIEMRPGSCNFSVIGRNATMNERSEYLEYDTRVDERNFYAFLIRENFPMLEATVAGETGIDIHPVGKDKSQIAEYISPFVFFGDKIYPGGNDYTIAQRAIKYYNVSTWEETFEILKKEYS